MTNVARFLISVKQIKKISKSPFWVHGYVKGVGRVLEMTLQPVLKLYQTIFFKYKRIIDIDNNGKGSYDSIPNNWTRILVLNLIYYDILKYTYNKEGSRLSS